MHPEPVCRRAGLATVSHLGDHRSLDGRVDVGVVEDEKWGVSAQLHRHPQELMGRGLDQALPHLGRARERELAQPRIGDQRSHRRTRRAAREHVQDALRQPRVLQNPRQGKHAQRRLLGRFHDRGAARGDRGTDLSGAHRHREVPRRDHQARPHRLAHRQQPPLAVGRHREAAVDPYRLLAEPPQELGRVGNFALCLGEWLSHLEGHDQRQLVGATHQPLVPATEDLSAIARRRLGPLGLHRAGRVERRHRVFGRPIGDLGNRLAGGRIFDVQRVAAGGVAPLPADEELLGNAVQDFGFFSGCVHRRNLDG